MPRDRVTFRADHLGSAIEGNDYSFEPQRDYAGYVVFAGGDLIRMGLDKFISNPEIAIVLAVDEFEIPKSRLNKFDLAWNAERKGFVASIEHDNPTITVRDFVDVPVVHLFDAWFSLIFNQYNGAIGFKHTYKSDAWYILLDHSTGRISRYYHVSGTYPQEFDSGNIDHNSSGFVKLNITMAAGRVFRLTPSQMKFFNPIGLRPVRLDILGLPTQDSPLSGSGFVRAY